MDQLPERELTIYEACWNERRCSWGFSQQGARTNVERTLWYGDPEGDDDYCLGTHWATSDDDHGWRIVSKELVLPVIQGELRGDFSAGETVHVIWQCPFCERYTSEDVIAEDSSPFLVCCGCPDGREREYLLLEFEK